MVNPIKETQFTTVLIANRGEIALRIMQGARMRGLRCVAVYTDADAGAAHVEFADFAVNIGDGPVGNSYMSVEKILAAANTAGADAIHPGYGFLSESAEFAQAVSDAGLVFIGPSANAIAAMGNKATAKQLMLEAGVTCVPGYDGQDQSDTAFDKAAGEIGYPVMIKAAAGGGGRGMRLVGRASELKPGLDLARAEAKNAFGSDQLILEAAVQDARHVEIQIFGDKAGNIIHLGERDCSLQRRHQKVIEEAPSPAVNATLRAAMGQAAIKAASSIAYEGAGTVEFLLDDRDRFYFLEMNTRLQVEHPVTEMVTGLDLVAMQFDVAMGQPLAITQDDVNLSGHAIEARLYAEDPTNGFLPTSGDVQLWQAPSGPGIRADSGIRSGQEISPFYDAMQAKIIAHGSSREEARQKLVKALKENVLFGLTSNRDFLIALLETPEFTKGAATTAFIDETYSIDERSVGVPNQPIDAEDVALVAALWYRDQQEKAANLAKGCAPDLLGWSSTGGLHARVNLRYDMQDFKVGIRQNRDGSLTITNAETLTQVDWQGRSPRVNGTRREVLAVMCKVDRIHLNLGSHNLVVEVVTGKRGDTTAEADGQLRAPMHGNLVSVLVEPGEQVKIGARLAILEAMKMQHELLAEIDGCVTEVHFAAGQQVRAGDLLLEIEAKDTGPATTGKKGD